MGLPHLTSFLCCMGLEMGAKFVGFLHLGVSLTILILCSIFATSLNGYVGTVEDEDLLYTTWYKIAIAICVMSVVHLLLASTLLYSAYKRKTTGLKVWVYVMCALWLCALLYLLVEVCARGFAGTGSDIFLALLEGVLFFGTVAYCVLCVYSYYLMLKSTEDMEGPSKADY